LVAGILGNVPGPGVATNNAAKTGTVAPDFRQLKLPKRDFDQHSAGLELVGYISDTLDTRLDSLRKQGVSSAKISDTQMEMGYRFVLSNGHQYRFAMAMGQPIDKDTVGFTDGWGSSSGINQGWTAFAKVEWDREQQAPIVVFINFSLLRDAPISAKLTKERLLDGIWEKICTTLEQLA
jgi:hypothetical protein